MNLARSLEVARRWESEGKAVAAATLVRVQGPAPRPLGSRFLVSSAGDMEGSVSGGCVENDVFLHAEQVLESGQSKLVGYGISDEAAFEVGLSCGGVIDVFIERFRIDEVGRFVASQRSGALASVVDGPGAGTRGVFDHELGLIAADLPAEVVEAILPAVRIVMDTEHPTITSVAGSEVFVEPVAPPPRLVIFGAVEIGQALSALAARVGFSVIVCDPRSAFTTPDRFPDAGQIITAWPEEAVDQLAFDDRTFVVVLSHDPKYEDPVVRAALARGVRYLGAMGSRKTHAKRLERLAGEGIPPATLARIHGPIGLDLGANGARETAVEILAEMVLVRHATGTAGSSSLPSAG
ncbi:MAG: XdhC family protein [Acidimicrobiia bacterium]|nr:XdhC family protein [Acidimicrobiia bacterium]